MTNNITTISREIDRAEQELIELRGNRTDDETDGLAVLYTGNWNESFPRQLVLDSNLSANEKITWQAIRLSVTNPSRPASIPRRDELARMVNCSPPTITTSRSMLRVCRWMTFCKTVRDQGRFVGTIYLFHDEPLTLESTLSFDPTYISFLQNQSSVGSKRIRAAAASMLREIDSLKDIEQPTELKIFANRLTNSVLGFGMAPPPNQSKNFATADGQPGKVKNALGFMKMARAGSQSKNFAAESQSSESLTNGQSKNFSTGESDQSKKFALDSQERNFLPLARGSNNNNSINNKYINAREEDDLEESNQPKKQRIERLANPNPDGDPEKTFALVLDYFPLLNSEAVKKYVVALFIDKENCIPVVHRMIIKLKEPDRSHVLLQLVGRKASDMHGWSQKKMINVIAFARTLVDRVESGEFFPDEFALGLEKAIASGNAPLFFNSPKHPDAYIYDMDE